MGEACYARWPLLALSVLALPVYSQNTDQETLVGSNSNELAPSERGYVFGNWGGLRTQLEEMGVDFDFQYVSDTLWNLKSVQPDRVAMWNRVRGTVDIDLGRLTHHSGWYFHATALWQGGGNLGAYLGTIASPSGMSSAPTFRMDSWWLEKRWLDQRITIRAGQFAGQDFYGAQHYAASFIFEPMGYALNNLFTTFESFDPPSTPAAEIRLVPLRSFFVKSMVLGSEKMPFSHNPTGLVPQFRGTPMSVSEIGYSPGQKAGYMRAFDNVESRKGYSGLYQFGAAFNPGRFVNPINGHTRDGNYLLYWMATQALWRLDPQEARGLDATFAYDWSPADVNQNNRLLTAGLRFNEPLAVPFHNTMSVGYVRNSLSAQYLTAGAPPWRSENGFEYNALLMVTRAILFQPVVQYFTDIGGLRGHALVLGFRTKVEL
jgi:porin